MIEKLFKQQIATLAEKLTKMSPDDPQYESYKNSFTTAMSIKNFSEYLDILGSEVTTLDELQAAYEHPIIISHNGHTLEVPFSAQLYLSLVNLVNIAKEEF
jgi:hypothetical protein